MADWALMDREWPNHSYYGAHFAHYQEKLPVPSHSMMSLPIPPPMQPLMPPPMPTTSRMPPHSLLPLMPPPAQPFGSPPMPLPAHGPTLRYPPPVPKPDNPREIRNKAEKQRRDKLNQSISELAAMVPPVRASSRKIDKTGVLRLTAHYLRAHQYVFGDSIGHASHEFQTNSAQAILGMLNGFLLTTTYRGIIVVASQNVQEYLGYNELDLLGQNIFNLTHDDDKALLKEQLMPKSQTLGPNGELMLPEEPEGRLRVARELAQERRRFVVRFKKLGQRSEPSKYVTCHVEGSLRKSDRACRSYNRCCQMVRRVRARGDNPCSSGNDVVFVGLVRPTTETFITESSLKAYQMEYRTRHSVDGEIIQCEQRISLVTGYMTHEVNGVNAMNFMHRDDVRWVIIALREMYDRHRVYGESCYRLMTKTGQFIYMKTRGRLDVDEGSRAVTSFVCTNTMVDEKEGKYLIKAMKKKFTIMVSNGDSDDMPEIEDIKDDPDDDNAAIENPKNLEKVILHLVTNLPSPQPTEVPGGSSPDQGMAADLRLSIIPHKRERIVNAIGKIYSVIKELEPPKDSLNPGTKRINPDLLVAHSLQIINSSTIPGASPIQNGNPTENENPIQNGIPIQNGTLIGNNSIRNGSPTQNVNRLQNYVPSPTELMPQSLTPQYTRSTSVDMSPQYANVMTSPSSDVPVYHSAIEQEMGYLDVAAGGFSPEEYGALPNPYPIPFEEPFMEPFGPGYPGFDVTNEATLTELDADVAIESLLIPSMAGVKRARTSECMGRESFSRKKISSPLGELNQQNDEMPLETLFDEAFLNTQIDSAINSLEQAIDPIFPELLVSKDVQDILEEIEGTTGFSQSDSSV